MKFTIYHRDRPPTVIEGERVRIEVGVDSFEAREADGLLVRIEEHNGLIALQLAVFPGGANSVCLKGGVR